MAYDKVTKTAVLFGGESAGGSSTLLADTWIWNGTSWKEVTPASSPPARRYAVMGYDPVAKKVVLFGGDFATDTWTWDGPTKTWTQRTPAVSPTPPRRYSTMAYDEVSGRLVLFGGQGNGFKLNDTWSWDGVGGTWVPETPLNSPTPRHSASMAYDAVSRKVILFGGQTDGQPPFGAGAVNETWIWDGATRNWGQASPLNRPPAREFGAMAYDAARQRVVLYGGSRSFLSGTLNDTWIWKKGNWVEQAPANKPGLGAQASLAYHGPSQQVVLFGGGSGATWGWNGINWKLRA